VGLFGRGRGADGSPGQDAAAGEAAERRREQDVERVGRGGVPLAAEARIAELAGRTDGFFTSGLSVADFALTRLQGVQPICQVMGSSVYQVGWQAFPWGSWSSGGSIVELTQLTEAWNQARSRALRRLAEEARAARADAVIDVSFERREHAFVDGAVEVVVNGTAVRLPDGTPQMRAAPRLSDLSAPDFTLLRDAGYGPAGVVAATSVVYVSAGAMTQQLTTGWQRGTANRELADFTQGVYSARENALGRATSAAQGLGAEGVVGTQVEVGIQVREWESAGNRRREDLIVTAHVVGTAIARHGAGAPPDPRVIVRQGALTR
jgi:uncharacterized protein YbjQ (UPF0145 family)